MSIHREKQNLGLGHDSPATVVLVNEDDTSKKDSSKNGIRAEKPRCQRCFSRSAIWAVGLGCVVLALIAGVTIGYAVWPGNGDDGQYRES